MSKLIIHNISKRYGGIQALNAVSAEVVSGAITGIIGPNGSGKTTLLNCISGTVIPDHGYIQYEGNVISKNPTVAYYGGAVRTFQSARVFPQLTVLENLLLIEDTRNVTSSLLISNRVREQEHKINSILEELGIKEKKDNLCDDLSYGQRKLVEMARVLLSDKDVILLDEPFAGLFPKMIQHLMTIIKNLAEKGKTIILVEHNPRIFHGLCNTVIVLDAGEVLSVGVPKEVFDLPEVREAYLGE